MESVDPKKPRKPESPYERMMREMGVTQNSEDVKKEPTDMSYGNSVIPMAGVPDPTVTAYTPAPFSEPDGAEYLDDSPPLVIKNSARLLKRRKLIKRLVTLGILLAVGVAAFGASYYVVKFTDLDHEIVLVLQDIGEKIKGAFDGEESESEPEFQS